MKKHLNISIVFLAIAILTSCTNHPDEEKVIKLEMKLSAFGVESDNIPNITARIDFSKDSGYCHKSYYNPENKDSSYYFSKKEIEEIYNLLEISDIKELELAYKVQKTDLPKSITIIHTNKSKYVVSDYGLMGDDPLQDLYKLVYRL